LTRFKKPQPHRCYVADPIEAGFNISR
jgi:hypothetical protein